MVSVLIEAEQIKTAKSLNTMGNLKGSITGGGGNLYGILGEVVVADYFRQKGFSVEHNPTYDYDLIINGFKIDVKTKHTTVPPQPHYLCSISNHNTHQKCQFYFFCRILKDYSRLYLLGYISPGEFYSKATFHHKGDPDPSNPNFKFRDDCYNLPVKQLHRFTID